METWWSKIKPAPNGLFYSRDKKRDPRLGDVVCRFDPKRHRLGDFRYALIGFPEDRGVRKNRGRPGAAQAPAEIRRAFYKLTAKDLVTGTDFRKLRLVDLGDIPAAASLRARQEKLGEVVASCLAKNLFPIVLGGGHETAYGHFLGYQQLEKKIRLLNIDAHLDLRPLENGLGHSGTPFRQMLETKNTVLKGNRLTIFGLQGFCNAERDLVYAQGKKVLLFWLEETRRKGIIPTLKQALRSKDRLPLYVTLDLDALRAAEFPATSAAPAQGFTPSELFLVMDHLAQEKTVRSLELAEYSPPLDRDGVCAKVVALLLYRFLSHRQCLFKI